MLRNKLVNILRDLLALGILNGIKEYGDVKSSLAFILRPDDNPLAINAIALASGLSLYGEGKLNRHFRERRNVLLNPAIRPYAAYIFSGG